MTDAPLPPTTASDAELRRKLGGVTCDAFGSDNLAIFLASEFEPGVESEELDESGTWKQGALDLADAVLDAIHAHYADRLDQLSAEVAAKDAALALWSESIIMSDDGRPISIRDIGMGYGGDVAMAAQETRACLAPRMEASDGTL